MENRIPKIQIILHSVINRDDVLKSNKEFINKYVEDNKETNWKGKNVLIFDTDVEYNEYETINLEDVRSFSEGKSVAVKRILPYTSADKLMTLEERGEALLKAIKDFSNGMIVISEIHTFLTTEAGRELIGRLCCSRSHGIDVVLNFLSIDGIPPRILINASIFKFYAKQIGSVDKHKKKLLNVHYEMFKIAEYLVEEKPKDFYCYLMKEGGYQQSAIKGDFTKEELQEACAKYVKQNKLETTVTEELIKKYYK